jgi:hypothetical protein
MGIKRGPTPMSGSRGRPPAGRKGPAGSRRDADYEIDMEKFVRLWEESDTAEEAAGKMSLPISVAVHRASAYRAAGIQLKKMPRKKSEARLMAERMNVLIGKIRKKRLSQGKDAPPPPVSGPATASPAAGVRRVPVDRVESTRDVIRQLFGERERTGRKAK